jgi:hypothetical protein
MGDKPKKKDKGGKRPTRRSFENQRRLTVMVFKNVGKVFTFKVSATLLLFAAIFLTLYIIATLFITNEYLDNYRRGEQYKGKIASLNAELEMANQNIEKCKEDIAFLNNYIEDQINTVSFSDDVAEDPIEDEPSNTDVTKHKLVDVEDLEVKRKNSVISLRFKLLNTLNNDEPVGGYVFVIVSLKESDKIERWVYPSCSLKDGMPENYKKGVRFFIRRFTIIEGDYKIGKTTDKTLTLAIVVYNRDGDVIFTRTSEL